MVSFEQVKAWYEGTKPVNEQGHGTKYDLRPIGERYKKWERVCKINDECYVLLDGGTGSERNLSDAERIKLAPFVWTIKDGIETVKISNETGQFGHVGRYQFIHNNLPLGLRFYNAGGIQYIYVGDERYYLAKRRTVSNEMHDANHGKDWYVKFKYTKRDDGAALTFIRNPYTHKFEYLLGGLEEPKRSGIKVNTKAKRKYVDEIEDLWKWICSVGTLIPTDDWTYARKLGDELRDAYFVSINKDDMVGTSIAYSAWKLISTEFALSILKDYNSDLRLNLAYDFLCSEDLTKLTTEADVKRVRARYNRWINRVCGFNIKQ